MTTDMSDLSDMDITEQKAFGLSRAAILLDQARQAGLETPQMSVALNHNLELWVAIRSYVENDRLLLNGIARDNLIRLSKYVADTTFKSVEGVSSQKIDSLININLQISEGMLEGNKKGS